MITEFLELNPWIVITFGVLIALVSLAVHDVVQKKRTIVHNFPIVGHLRYFLEMIGPELRQYWVANDKEEKPFNRSERAWIYASAKGQNNNFGFGTTEIFMTLAIQLSNTQCSHFLKGHLKVLEEISLLSLV